MLLKCYAKFDMLEAAHIIQLPLRQLFVAQHFFNGLSFLRWSARHEGPH